MAISLGRKNYLHAEEESAKLENRASAMEEAIIIPCIWTPLGIEVTLAILPDTLYSGLLLDTSRK